MADDQPATRAARDWQGEVRIPSRAYFGAQTQRVLDYHPISGRVLAPEIIWALGKVKYAAAVVHGRLGLLDEDVARAIQLAAGEVASGELLDHFPLDDIQVGSGTSSNMNANEVIANRANELLGSTVAAQHPVHPTDHVNLGQSSNDVFPTAVHIAALHVCERQVVPALVQLKASLESKALEFADLVKPGRTHLMDAAPVFLGQELGGYARQVELGVERVQSALSRLVELPLGGTAVGTGLNATAGAMPQILAELVEVTGIAGLVEASNHFEAQGSRDALVELSSMLKVVAVSLTKVANDIRWMASGPRTGLDEIRIPFVAPSSSIMPAKGTPAIPELVAQLCAQIVGNDVAVTTGGQGGVFELNAYAPLIARNVLDSAHHLTRAAVLLATMCVDGIEAQPAKMAAAAEASLAIAAALVPRLGYETSARIVQHASVQGCSISEAMRELGVDTDPDLLDVKVLAAGGRSPIRTNKEAPRNDR